MAEDITSELVDNLLSNAAGNSYLPADADAGIQNNNNCYDSNLYNGMNVSGWYVFIHDFHDESRKEHIMQDSSHSGIVRMSEAGSAATGIIHAFCSGVLVTKSMIHMPMQEDRN